MEITKQKDINSYILKKNNLLPVIQFPRYLMLQTISFCNGKCIICPYTEVHNKFNQGLMHYTLLKKIIKECKKQQELSFIGFTLQNEPLLDTRLLKFIQFIKNELPDVGISLVTNGILLSSELSKKLILNGLDEICISLHGVTEKTYTKISPGHSSDQVIQNVITFFKLNEQYNGNVKISVSIVKNKINHHEILRNKIFWKRYKIESNTYPLSNRIGCLNNFDDLISDNMDVYHFFQECIIPFQTLSILYNGDVLLCCQDWGRENIVGNLYNQSIKEIWQNEKMNNIRNELLKKSGKNILPCSKCLSAK